MTIKNRGRISRESSSLLIRASRIHGRGVFARQSIPKGKFIIEYTGEKISREEGIRRDKLQKSDGKFYVFALDSKWCVDGSTGGNARLINHSCNPNCIYQRKNGKIWIRTRRKIRVGEELTYDYEDSDKGLRVCACGAKNCTGFM